MALLGMALLQSVLSFILTVGTVVLAVYTAHQVFGLQVPFLSGGGRPDRGGIGPEAGAMRIAANHDTSPSPGALCAGFAAPHSPVVVQALGWIHGCTAMLCRHIRGTARTNRVTIDTLDTAVKANPTLRGPELPTANGLRVEHPLNHLFVEGRSCKIFRNSEQHQNLENGIGLIPWGNGGTLIDRFDGRALLDFYKEPDASAWTRPKNPQEEKLEQVLLRDKLGWQRSGRNACEHVQNVQTQSLRFESFRDAVRLVGKGLTEPEGLAFARQENIEIRAAMRAAATAAAAAAAGQRHPPPLGIAMPATGTGVFAAVGFNYGGNAGGSGSAAGAGDSSSCSSDSDDDDDSDDEDVEGASEDADAGQEAEDDRIDDIAEQYGLTDFSYRLHRTLQQEGEDEARMRKPPRRRVSRKNARERARRMAGMGLDPTGAPIGPARDWTQPPPRSAAQDNIRILPPRPARDAADDGGHRRRRSRSRSRSRSRTRSRSRSPGRHRYTESGRTQYITEFSSALAPGSRGVTSGRAGPSGGSGGVAAALVQQQLAANRPSIDRSMFEREEAILDALPDMPDPAALGAQPIPLPPTSVQAIRAAAAEGGRRDGRTGGGGGGGSRRERERDERERERERERNYHGYSYRRRYEHSRRSSRSQSRSRSRSRSRERERDRDQDRDSRDHERPSGSSEADRLRDRQRSGSGTSTSGYGAPKGTMPGGGATAGGRVTAAGGSGPAGAAAVKETPQERLKRIMAAQLNKQAQKDHLVAAQRKLQVEKEKEARQALERVVMRRSPSPPARDRERDRDRSDYDSYRRKQQRSTAEFQQCQGSIEVSISISVTEGRWSRVPTA
ncbi:hypothetical protein VOLCADRAFT_103657 [Volvox carteri f. nagariensis]|uniref:Suppressor of white apricot N-terminal domain-containing protein n=1 Tax=Volvox carteri f. nagariensis TaxID=3068 RepID=D8TNM8_VOLCA|nr:uncharacterized protein VOLCADRAFT_103657 [Volvox carteri f. nagariensis]EFJ50870.1 hypothetical protein VOLCADRAFT_103657 [Volvox carteri f. nagariensis]|eukprot:XP_002947882.1 hypothetical protein VOLCADRAFT_103657 [Volvox carteri f. nagariensis]